jgi:hypothetical protein
VLWYTAQLREMQAASADEISRSKRLREVADSRVRELQVGECSVQSRTADSKSAEVYLSIARIL